MCGRFTIAVPIEDIVEHFALGTVAFATTPRYNVAPTQTVSIVRNGETGVRELALARWGLVPSWAKDQKIGNRLINARAETVAEKPAFRTAFKHRRCLVPADGFYEWQRAPSSKTPFWIGMKNHGLFAFAGLWEDWTDKAGGEHLESFTIITTDSNDLIRPIHDRMPVILPPADYDAWLAPTTPGQSLTKLLQPFDASRMLLHEVSRAVNGPANDRPELVAPVDGSLSRN